MANQMRVSIAGISQAFDELMHEFTQEEQEKVEKIAKDVAVECRKNIRRFGKEQQGRADSKTYKSFSWSDYLSGWNYKRIRQGKVVNRVTYHVHNQSKPGLAHLLEFGHAKVNQYGQVSGSTNKYPHVMPSEEIAKKEFFNRLKEEL